MLFKNEDVSIPQKSDDNGCYGMTMIQKLKVLVADDETIQIQLREAQMGDILCYHTDGKWSQHTLIANIIKYIGPCDLQFSTWTITEEPLRVLFALKEKGLIREIKALFDERIRICSANGLQFAETFFDSISMTKTHAKITILKNTEFFIVIVGSSNFTRNPRLEAGVIMYSKEAVNYYQKLLNLKSNDDSRTI